MKCGHKLQGLPFVDVGESVDLFWGLRGSSRKHSHLGSLVAARATAEEPRQGGVVTSSRTGQSSGPTRRRVLGSLYGVVGSSPGVYPHFDLPPVKKGGVSLCGKPFWWYRSDHFPQPLLLGAPDCCFAMWPQLKPSLLFIGASARDSPERCLFFSRPQSSNAKLS